MKTILTDSPQEAAAFLRSGEAVAFPTETVYGLGADALNADAVRKVFEAKGRPSDNPLIVHVASVAQIAPLVTEQTAAAEALIERFFPGPLTVILKKSEAVPAVVSAGLTTIALRMPDHPTATAFLQACDRPVAAPSANRSGRPSPTSWKAVREDLDGRIRCILRGGRSQVGLESTVVDYTSSPPVVLRVGAISLERLQEVVPDIELGRQAEEEAPRSPGVRHRHYAPQAEVVIVERPPSDSTADEAYIGLTPPKAAYRVSRVCRSVDEYAYELFDFFRRCDASGVRRIVCEQVDERGLGRALMDRLRRASERS